MCVVVVSVDVFDGVVVGVGGGGVVVVGVVVGVGGSVVVVVVDADAGVVVG